MPVQFRLTTFALVAAALSACETIPFVGGDEADADVNYAAGSPLGAMLSDRDEIALENAFLAAIESSEAQSWRGPRGAGAVTPAGWSLGNLKPDPTARIPAARPDLDLSPVMETDLGLYALTRNSNVRTGPGTEHAVAQTLPSGAGVDVVGKTVDGDWALVAADGAVRGYIYSKLMIKAPGTELELAGGPRRQAVLCREFVQRLSVRGERDQWQGAACREDGEWRLAPREVKPGEEGGPALLLTE